MRLTNACVALAIGYAMCACKGSQDEPSTMFMALEAKAKADAASSETERLAKQLDEMEVRVRTGEILRENDYKSWAYLDPAAGPSYMVAETNVSPILVSFTSVQAVADGSTVSLKLGNLSTARFSGAKLYARYNVRAPSEDSERGAWLKRQRVAEAKVNGDLIPGMWNVVQVSLPGIKPDALGHLEIKVELDTVYMSTPSS